MNEVILLVLENKLGITNQIALAKAEERISKQKAKHLYDSGKINEIEVGTFTIILSRITLIDGKFNLPSRNKKLNNEIIL